MKPRIERKVILALTLFLHSATQAQQLFPGPAMTPAPPGLSEMSWTFGLDPVPSGQEVVSVLLPGHTPRVDPSVQPSRLAFERNEGQVDAEVKFIARGPGYHLFLTQTEAVLVPFEARSDKLPPHPRSGEAPVEPWTEGDVGLAGASPHRYEARAHPAGTDARPASHVLRMRLVGANPSPSVRGEDELRGKVSYFIGNDPSLWRTNISTVAQVRLEQVYPGIDLVYYGNEGQLEYDFIVAPGADAHAIALAFEGADDVALDGAGELVLRVGEQQLSWRRPLVYQQADGVRREIAGTYRLGPRPTEGATPSVQFVSFEVAAYDRTLALVIDPALVYGTFLGGSDAWSWANGIAVDRNGNAYVVGLTASAQFPTKDPLQAAKVGSSDLFVTKLDATGHLVYSTYLGGSGQEFCCYMQIAVDSAGSSYVASATTSTDFPIVNAVQPKYGGGPGFGDAVLVKLSPDGSALVYSTYLGGSGGDAAFGLAVDSTGNAFVCGITGSLDFPTTNAFQPHLKGSNSANAFVAKLNPTGSALVYSTYLGGSGDVYAGTDRALALAVDEQGSAYICGQTASTDFPTVAAYQSRLKGTLDAFFAKLSPTGDALLFSSYLGGSGRDFARAIAVGGNGDVYLAGTTPSGDFPTVNALQPQLKGSGDAFIARYNPSSTNLVFSTYFGGGGEENAAGLALDSADNVYVAGATYSGDFPTTADALQPAFGGGGGSLPGDGFLSVLSSDGNSLIYSSYLGGSGTGNDLVWDLALDQAGNVYLGGQTYSADLPVPNPIIPNPFTGQSAAYVVTLSPIVVPAPRLQFTGNLTISNGLFWMWLTGPSGSNVVVEASANFEAWTPIQTNVLSPTGLGLSVPLGTNQTQFFRARLAP